MSDFGYFVERLSKLSSAEAVIQEWHRSLERRFGKMHSTYGYFMKGGLPGRDQYFDSTFDPSFLDDYAARARAGDDLAYQLAEKGAGPFTWDRMAQRTEMTQTQGSVFHDCAEAGMKVGMSSSLFSEPGVLACFSTASAESTFEMDTNMAEIYAMTCAMHQAHMQLLKSDASLGQDLTVRERQVFELYAAGLSAWAISERLSVSVGTVRFHIAACYDKLGCREKVLAVTKALYTGQIGVDVGDLLNRTKS